MGPHKISEFFAYVKATHKDWLYFLAFIIFCIFIYLITNYLYLIQQNREYRHPNVMDGLVCGMFPRDQTSYYDWATLNRRHSLSVWGGEEPHFVLARPDAACRRTIPVS